MSIIKENILSSFNSEKNGAEKTIENILNEKGMNYGAKKNLYKLYEREAEHLVRTSFLIKNHGNLYILSRNDEDKYYLEKAGIMDRVMNFLNYF